ncbi:MAG: polyprenyl synthetase family protein [Planctomycetota bacterium]|nr:polyprenyl synthetase family protein [Planctomycetota bacterium]
MAQKNSHSSTGRRPETTSHGLVDLMSSTGNSVETFLSKFWLRRASCDSEVMSLVRSTLPDVGLRLRPHLLRVAFEAGGDGFEEILPVAAGVELLQLSTLVIDDILDESDLRNNKPSIFARRGAKETLSIGSIMFAIGFSLIAEGLNENTRLKNPLGIVDLFARTHARIYDGQILDMRLEGDPVASENQYLGMITRTTACFVQASLVSGAMLWDAPPGIIRNLEKIGAALGMACQIRDDVIDVVGDSICTGKPVGGDMRRGKMRLPVIRALSVLPPEKRTLLESLLRQKGLPDQQLEDALALLAGTDCIDYCIRKTKEYCGQVNRHVSLLPDDLGTLKMQLGTISDLISSFENGDD